MNTLIELHDKAVAAAVAAAIACKGDRDTPTRAALVAGIESLQAEVEQWKVDFGEMKLDHDALRAELDALKSQEPVAIVDSGLLGCIGWTATGESLADGQELFTRAAPQAPAPTGQAQPTKRQFDLAMQQWEQWKQYALGLQERLVKYEGGAPMHLNAAQPATPQAPAKPLAWQDPNDLNADTAFRWCQIGTHTQPVFAAPQAPAPERNFCERCGKRLVKGHIHTCTPPTGEAQG